MVEARVPRIATLADLATAPAVSLAMGTATPGPATGPLTAPPHGASLRRNPLYEAGEIRWPFDRYAMEYGPLATYPATTDAPAQAMAGESAAIDALTRRRVLVDLPERW